MWRAEFVLTTVQTGSFLWFTEEPALPQALPRGPTLANGRGRLRLGTKVAATVPLVRMFSG